MLMACSKTGGPFLSAIDSPRLFAGNDTLAFRDPAAIYENGGIPSVFLTSSD